MSRAAAIDAALAIDDLLHRTPQLWRGREPNRNQRTLPTGHARLDARLPGGGWPLGAVTELITRNPGLGEFSLLFPALAELSRNGEWLILVDPPWIPYPAALHGHGLALERLLLVRSGSAKESLWACEQALAGSRGGAVLAWPEQLSFARLRRLQLAAEAGAKPAFLFRPESALHTASPAALRLHLSPAGNSPRDGTRDSIRDGTRIDILKCRGERPRKPAWLPPRHPGADIPPSVVRPEPGSPLAPAAAAGPQRPLPVPSTLN
jgi:cell division inhibitor SulA/protein ImuA